MDVEAREVKERIKAAWELGDYVKVAQRLEDAARELVDACAVSAGQEILDVAAGNGNVAVLAAREGARVVASDITPGMVELGRMRTRSEGLEVEWVEADVEALPLDHERFDAVLSAFGAMFAPRPEVAAAEMFRVARPEAVVGMVSWTPESFQAEMFDLMNRYAPPPPEGLPRPVEWGREATVAERLEGLASSVETARRTLRWTFDSPDDMWAFFGQHAGPSVALQRSLEEERQEALRSEFLELVEQRNLAADGSVAIDGEYLLVVARRPGSR
ncbi:MAG: methyltransferase domain-containing protein [Actinomycetota bacterium]|nr:methyltransferase domain-containing protein [Actinomycetota bacterium]